MTAGEQIEGTATYGRPRTTRRPVVGPPEPVPTVCVCGTEQPNPCPQNCPTRDEPNR